LLFAGFAGVLAGAPAFAQNAPVPVVATFSILGDLVREVGGDRVAVSTLVGPDGDGHVYSPTPSDARRLSEARIVVANGLGFEGWISRLVRSSGTKATVVEASSGIKPLAGDDDHADHGHKKAGHGKAEHSHGSVDPHAWQSVPNVKTYVANIRAALIAADPAGQAAYEANATAYLAKLDALDAQIRAAIANLPPERRKVITTHDAFAYFEAAYGLDFIAPQGVSTEAEASAKDVARIIRQMKKEKIGAVFLENVSDPRLTQQIARETGARIGGKLYSDALSPADGPAGTYIEMMRHNIRVLTEALSS
jgi:zinc/manganese transport system substrate-binding protein